MSRKQLTCNSCVFYGSFYEAVSLLPLESQGKVYDAIFKFAFENLEVELEGIELAVFLLIKPQLIANRAKYENGCKGGRPKKEGIEQKASENRGVFDNEDGTDNLNETENKPSVQNNLANNQDKVASIKTQTKPKNNLNETKPKPNENDNENDNENVKEKEIKRKLSLSTIQNLYNSICTNLPKCTEMTLTRKNLINKCLYSLDELKALFEKSNTSSFLCGKNKRGFKANFDWLMKNDNAVKVFEGVYDDSSSDSVSHNSQIISDKHKYSKSDFDNLASDENNYDF